MNQIKLLSTDFIDESRLFGYPGLLAMHQVAIDGAEPPNGLLAIMIPFKNFGNLRFSRFERSGDLMEFV